MDGLTLLDEARAARLMVSADGERLVVTGPREAGAIATRLIAAKRVVLMALAMKRSYAPLDEAIAADVARKYARDAIEDRLLRLDAAATVPTATALDRVVVDDWRCILAAKGAASWP